MFAKGSKINSIFQGNCPRCHKESMYINKNPYQISKLFAMHERCSNCNTKYKIEPSFFYGAMYVNYGLGIIIAVVVFIIAKLLIGLSLFSSIIAIAISILILFPLIIRLSRNIWINLFISYDSKGTQAKF